MNKSELIKAVAECTDLNQAQAGAAVKAVFAEIEKALAAGDKVQIVGFGTFESKDRLAREGKNPKTLEKVAIPACKAPVFKAGKALKEALNKEDSNDIAFNK